MQYLRISDMTRLDLLRQFLEQEVEDENSNTDSNGTIGDIKCRPVQVADVEIQKIDHFPGSYSIDKITYGTTENHCKSGR